MMGCFSGSLFPAVAGSVVFFGATGGVYPFYPGGGLTAAPFQWDHINYLHRPNRWYICARTGYLAPERAMTQVDGAWYIKEFAPAKSANERYQR